ncbi:MAG: ATP-binding cassette domain-containing protein [Planctomycetaceae bacterium]|nr:ATP-binding cassette domain-containing protein [Planctomycetaceae bacterium]
MELYLMSSREHESHEHPTPFFRAVSLLRPETGDIGIIVLFALVAGLLAMATPLAIEALVSTVTFGRLLQPVIVLSLLLLAFLMFQAAIRSLQTYVVEVIQRRLMARVAGDVAWRLPRVRYEALHGGSGRELVNRFFDIVTVQKVSAQLLLDGISVVLNTLIGMLVLGFYHPWLLGFDVFLLVMICFAILVLGHGAVRTSIRESACKYRLAAWLEDLAGCALTFRQPGGVELALEQADRLTADYLTARRSHFRILLRQIIFALALQAIASTVLLGLGGWLVIAGQLTMGQLVAAELIVTVIVGSFAKLGKHMESYYDLMAAVDKLGYLFDLPLENQGSLTDFPSDHPAEVHVTELGFSLPDGRPLFEDLCLTIPSGGRVVLPESTPSGKSILLDLLYGLRVPSAGFATINGVSPRELSADVLRRHVALVRETELFQGTVAENISVGRQNVTPDDVRNALEAVGVLDQIRQLPQGMETEIDCTGHPLTPGQQRRLMIARAIAGRPLLLLIDGVLDAFSDGDSDSLMEWLISPDRPWTLIVVTGRQSLIRRCSQQLKLVSQDKPAKQ